MFDFKNRNIRLLLITIVLFTAAFLFNDPLELFKSDYTTSSPVLKEKSGSSFNEIKIIHSGDSNQVVDHLLKKDNQWYIKTGDTEYQADNKKINRALEDLLQMRRYYVVTSNADKYQEFEVTDNGFQIFLKGNQEYTILIGKQGASYNTSLIRLKGEKKVYSIKGNLKNDWNQSAEYFRNRLLLHVAKENIDQIDLKGPVNYSLVNHNNEWSLTSAAGNSDTRKPRIERILDDLAAMEGLNFQQGVNPGRYYGKIIVHLKSNIAFNIDVRKSVNEYYIKSDYNPYWQTISEYRIKSIFPDISEVKGTDESRKKQ